VQNYIVGTIRELSVFEEGQVSTYPYKNWKNRQKSWNIVKFF